MQQRWERIAQRVDTETKPVRRFTKGEIAQRLRISRPALARRLSGQVDWHYDELETLAILFGTTVGDLVGDGFGDNHTTVSIDP